MVVLSLLVLGLLCVVPHPSKSAFTGPPPPYIVQGTPTAANPAQNLRIFCVTDVPYGPAATAQPAPTASYSVVPNDTSKAGANVSGINQAIKDCIVAGGGVVYFPPGIYYVNSTIIVPPSVTVGSITYLNKGVILTGAGAEATGIYAVAPFTSPTPTATVPAPTPPDTALVAIGFQAAAGYAKPDSTPISNCWVRDMSLQTVYGGASGTSVTNIGTVLEFTRASISGCENVHVDNSNNGIWFKSLR